MLVNTDSRPLEHQDDDFVIYLPRNLSYAEESYLDNYSVSSLFVNASKAETNLRKKREIGREMEYEFSRYAVKVKDEEEAVLPADRDIANGSSVDEGKMPDDGPYDTQSEEGVFVNAMDDLDSLGTSEVNSDTFSVDSINSLEEVKVDKLGNTEIHEIISSEPNTELKKASSEGCIGTKFARLHVDIDGKASSDKETRKYLLQIPESPVYDDPEFNFNKAELRKSSSLKTNKTPPGTPRRKKMVRFADAMGLDLESIRHVLNTDAPPKIPASAMADLKVGIESDRRDLGSRYLDLCFPQPGALENFNQKVMAQKVSLENCLITDLNITGVVRVANIGYHKCVRVRYTINNWVSFYDIMASYIQNSCDGPTDRFSFTMVAPAVVGPGSRMEFAVSFTVNDTVYWDNNDGQNYGIVCYAKTTPTELESSWVHFV